MHEKIKNQCCQHIETSQLNSRANLVWFLYDGNLGLSLVKHKVNPFLIDVPILYLLKTPKNHLENLLPEDSFCSSHKIVPRNFVKSQI